MKPQAHARIEIELPEQDLVTVRKAADAAGMTVGQYFRSAMAAKIGTSRPSADDLAVTVAGADRDLDGFAVVPMPGETQAQLAERQAQWDLLVRTMGQYAC